MFCCKHRILNFEHRTSNDSKIEQQEEEEEDEEEEMLVLSLKRTANE